MIKPKYLGFLVLDLSKIQIYHIWFNYIKEKLIKKENLSYIDKDSFMILSTPKIFIRTFSKR